MQSHVQLPRPLLSLMTAAYPWLLAAILIGFVWQTVAARRAAAPPPPPEADAGSLNCQTLSHEGMLGPIPEASGLALSARTPGILWSMNDSGTPVVFAIDVMGRVLSSVRITGADINNWEDISVGPCGNGSCLYVADTGNEGGTQRNDVVIYRVPEPAPTDSRTAPAETFNAAYPADEDHESEAMFVAGGQFYLVTKGHPSLVFRFPRGMQAGTLATLERVGQVPTEQFQATTIRRQTRITDAETSPDGKWVAMRTNKELLLYRAEDVIAGRFERVWHLDLAPLDEAQGEGVVITNEGDVYLAAEGGGHGLPGTFAHLKCALPR
ncbi:MAG TPA: hypothetical protein VN654_15135 [Vicinamibacterales bacterium]|jgi:hypothetical protein|nr:hypothetical protein [Vicinamibacterales bacterium]